MFITEGENQEEEEEEVMEVEKENFVGSSLSIEKLEAELARRKREAATPKLDKRVIKVEDDDEDDSQESLPPAKKARTGNSDVAEEAGDNDADDSQENLQPARTANEDNPEVAEVEGEDDDDSQKKPATGRWREFWSGRCGRRWWWLRRRQWHAGSERKTPYTPREIGMEVEGRNGHLKLPEKYSTQSKYNTTLS